MEERKNVFLNKSISIKNMKERYNLKEYKITDINIGYDESIWVLFSKNSEYRAIEISVDWENEKVIEDKIIKIENYEKNFNFIQPIENNILLVAARCRNYQKGPENNAIIINRQGKMLEEFCLGDGIENCLVDKEGKIITSYFDEGIFGNCGWEKPIGINGLIIWNKERKIIWEAEYPIYDCYAINIDEKGYLWFYYYNDFNLVKVNYNDKNKKDMIYKPLIDGCTGFLITKSGTAIIFYGGYYNKGEFEMMPIYGNKLGDLCGLDFIYESKVKLFQRVMFRGAKAILLDNQMNLFFKNIVEY